MGGAVSTGVNNDDLIDNLLEADYIRTEQVEHVFRAVDRGHYFLPDARGNAYKDLAWKYGHLHMSAPCIYTEVMEGLCLQPGVSFLNLGSGTGYLSTLAGLIIGSNGINHGIEIHEDVVQYAYKRLDEFKRQSGALDEFDFCEPKFVVGNCLCLTTDLKYDRVYCGAGCPPEYENYVKSLLKVGGILVIPLNDQLIQFKRVSETSYYSNTLLPVSFATLIVPNEQQEMVDLLSCDPLSLQSLCRAKVRNILRKNIEKEFPEEIKRPRHNKKPRRKERILRRVAVPLFEEDTDSEDESNHRHEEINFGRGGLMGRGVIMIREQAEGNSINNRNNDRTSEGQEVERLNSTTDNELIEGNRVQTNSPPISFNVHEEIQAIMDLYSEARQVLTSALNEQDSDSRSLENNVSDHVSNNSSEKQVMDFEETLEESSVKEEAFTDVAGTSKDNNSKRGNRVKFDSGLGDEIAEKDIAMTSESSDPEHIEVDSSSSSAEETEGKRNKRSKAKIPIEVHGGAKWRRINLSVASNGSDSENMHEEEEPEPTKSEHKIMVPSPYTPLMASKIQQLPLPHVLKKYLNYYKEF